MSILARTVSLVLSLQFVPEARAWDEHQAIVDRLITTSLAGSRPYLKRRITIPCREEEIEARDAIAKRIMVRADAIPVYAGHSCDGKASRKQITVTELLRAGFVDEPDLGMDQNLPESADPSGFRRWMGGVQGPTSQGFRHMVFPGMEWFSPLQTFQLPVSRIGQAFERIDLLGAEIRGASSKGDAFWALRLALWREHFLQDLYQPFHTTQVPSLRMVPWSAFFTGFIPGLVKRTTHAISNYHYAYEGLALEWVKNPPPEAAPESGRCFESAEPRAYQGEGGFSKTPRRIAPALGAALYSALGDSMKSEEVNLPDGKGALDYYVLLNAKAHELSGDALAALGRADRTVYLRADEAVVAIERVKTITCDLMREVGSGFWGNLDALFQELTDSNSSKTGR